MACPDVRWRRARRGAGGVPDAPEWVEARAIVRPTTKRGRDPVGGQRRQGLGDRVRCARLMIAVGSVKAGEAMEALAGGRRGRLDLLAGIEREDLVAAAETAGHAAARAAIPRCPRRHATRSRSSTASRSSRGGQPRPRPGPLAAELPVALGRGARCGPCASTACRRASPTRRGERDLVRLSVDHAGRVRSSGWRRWRRGDDPRRARARPRAVVGLDESNAGSMRSRRGSGSCGWRVGVIA